MPLLEQLDAFGPEEVVVARDPGVGYTALFVLHSTVLGPAVGGTRLRSYPSLEAALGDALRLARGMTCKNALAGLPFGGGKSVILGPPPTDASARIELFRAHGRAIERLDGRYMTGEDVGTTTDDMAQVARETAYVGGLDEGMGDPSPFTAYGVVRAMEAVAMRLWGSFDLSDRHVSVQGLGNVGMQLARQLDARGARLTVTDVVADRVTAAAREFGADTCQPAAILHIGADLFAPCALGGVLDDAAVDRLRVQAVCGGANNVLASPTAGVRLSERGILYAPDYVANAGGVISGGVDLAGWDRARMQRALDGVRATMAAVFDRAERESTTPETAADRMAEERLRDSADRTRRGA
ncbi:MAG: leucine dehydrogenase [Gemmatimonadetes bacterium]|nr:leucine dehydrogenase [Gemmatimonadota bacterium]